MKLSECLEKTVLLLQQAGGSFAVAGGLAAGLYRKEPRLTGDVDFVFAKEKDDLGVVRSIIKQLGFREGLVRQAEFDGGPLVAIKKKNTPVVMVVGREKDHPHGVGADFLLPSLPWVHSALERAQRVQVDFGFGPVPVLTVEDVVLSKLYAQGKAVSRPKDLDDLQSIFLTNPELDLGYLRAQIENLGIKLSKSKREFLPESLRKLL